MAYYKMFSWLLQVWHCSTKRKSVQEQEEELYTEINRWNVDVNSVNFKNHLSLLCLNLSVFFLQFFKNVIYFLIIFVPYSFTFFIFTFCLFFFLKHFLWANRFVKWLTCVRQLQKPQHNCIRHNTTAYDTTQLQKPQHNCKSHNTAA